MYKISRSPRLEVSNLLSSSPPHPKAFIKSMVCLQLTSSTNQRNVVKERKRRNTMKEMTKENGDKGKSDCGKTHRGKLKA